MSIDLPIHPTPAVQPAPVPNDGPHIADLVIADLQTGSQHGAARHPVADAIRARKELGTARYGTPLQPFNGRDPLTDLIDEVLDACQYACQYVYERAAVDPDDPDLLAANALYADLLDMACALDGLRARRAVRDQQRAAIERAVQAAELAALVEAGYAAERHAAQEAGDA